MTTTTTITSYPWQPGSTVTGDLAIKNLREGLMKARKNERGIHSETILTAVGALAGFAAQNAALSRATSGDPQAPRLSIAIAQTKSGEKWIFGDALNAFIYSESHSVLPIVAIIYGAVAQAGVPANEFPNAQEMAAHIAAVIGTSDFGKLSAPAQHQPQLQPLELLRRLWPLTRDTLQRPPHKAFLRRAEKPLQELHWPIIISIVGSHLIAMTKAVLDPRIGAALIMESAVSISKIDPEQIEPGKWRIESGEGAGPIIRLRD